MQQLPIDCVLVIPSGDHPHKRNRDMAPAQHRLAMCELAFAGLPGVRVDDRELRRSGPSFTVDTLEELQREAPTRQLFFLIGSDNLPLLPTWKQHHRLLQLATMVTYPRAGYAADPQALAQVDLSPAERQRLLARVLDVPADAVSATDLRARLRAGERRPDDLPPAVADYIAANDLYR